MQIQADPVFGPYGTGSGTPNLRSFTDKDHHFWLEQNPAKNSKWANLARQGHEMAWEFASPGGAYTGRILIDGTIYTTSEATKQFLSPSRRTLE